MYKRAYTYIQVSAAYRIYCGSRWCFSGCFYVDLVLCLLFFFEAIDATKLGNTFSRGEKTSLYALLPT